MISVLSRSISTATIVDSLKLSTQITSIDGKIIPVVAGLISKSPPLILKNINSTLKSPNSTPKTVSTVGILPISQLKLRSGLGVASQVRFTHHDSLMPNYDFIRHKNTSDVHKKVDDAKERRYTFAYMQTGLALVSTVYIAKGVVRNLVGTLNPSAAQLAIAKLEINISEIPEGKSMTFKWRGAPVFVKHRTEEEINRERSVDLSTLRDPQTDESRTTDPKWLVVVGVCTHLGCIPISNAGDYGGYYCPCHGSHYDGSGRIRKGPAPLNLTVPNHSFEAGGVLVIG